MTEPTGETHHELLTSICRHLSEISEQLGRIACGFEELNETLDHVQGTASYGPQVGFIRISNIND